jgi:hypothetical protein
MSFAYDLGRELGLGKASAFSAPLGQTQTGQPNGFQQALQTILARLSQQGMYNPMTPNPAVPQVGAMPPPSPMLGNQVPFMR